MGRTSRRSYALLALFILAALLFDLPYMNARALCRKIDAGESIEVKGTVGLAHPGWIIFVPGYPEYDLYVSPLYEACKQQNVAAVEKLLANGADPNLTVLTRQTPLEILPWEHGVTEDYLSILYLLIEYGADPTFGHYRNPLENLVLRLDDSNQAIFAERAVLYLLNRGVDISTFPIMIIAAKGSSTEVVRALLEQYDIDVNIQISEYYKGRTPLMMAADSETASRYEIAALLLSYGADPSLYDDSGQTAMEYAINKGDSQMVEVLSMLNQ